VEFLFLEFMNFLLIRAGTRELSRYRQFPDQHSLLQDQAPIQFSFPNFSDLTTHGLTLFISGTRLNTAGERCSKAFSENAQI
jgi:hypothetical protein